MIETSAAYDPYTVVRDIDMVVTFPAISPTAASYATYSATDKESFSDLTQLNNLNYTDTKYATCEDNLVKLDGSFRFLPDVLSNQQIGWWTDILSDENGWFQYSPTFTATLSQQDTAVGFSIYSSKTNPISECRVTVYSGATEIYDEVFTSDNETMIIDLPVSEFDRVVVTDIFTKEPFRRVKVLGFQFGIVKRWDRNNIVSASIQESADYTGNTLPINTLKVEFDNSTHEFDLFGATRKYVYRDATNTASVTAQNAHTVARINQVKKIDTKKMNNYATCENDFVKLNGEYSYIPSVESDWYQVGYVNNVVSNSSGQFSSTPTITYSWNKNISFSGFILRFGEKNYATSITATAYNGNSIIDSTTITNNDDEYATIDLNVSGCNKITFSFGGTNAQNRFIKLWKIMVVRYVDSWGSYLTKRQKVIAQFTVNGEEIPMGDSYLFDSLKQINGGLTAEITAKSEAAYLDNQNYEGSTGYTCVDVALALVVPEATMRFKPTSLIFEYVNKTTPKNTTKRAALHYLAQAVKATVFYDRQGRLTVMNMKGGNYVDEIDSSKIYSNDIARMNEYVNMVRLTVKNEYTSPETSQTYYGGSGLYYREIQNNCVYADNGTSTAEWLLQQYQRRLYFEIETRGNPALELGDTIRIITQTGVKYLAVIYDQLFEYDGALKCTIKAVEAISN